jgi:spermidine synthase
MARPWRTLATVSTDEGALELRQRGDDPATAEFLIVIGGRVLMTSTARRSEEALSTLAFADLAELAAPRVLIGGLGMAFTLRAALDVLPPRATVTVAELNPDVVSWCRGPLAPITGHAVADPRVMIALGDVARVIAEAPPGSYDAILLDLYEGPNAQSQRADDPFYGAAALARTRRALAVGGVLGVWSEDADAAFGKRFGGAGFTVTSHRIGSGGRRHLVYLGRR